MPHTHESLWDNLGIRDINSPWRTIPHHTGFGPDEWFYDHVVVVLSGELKMPLALKSVDIIFLRDNVVHWWALGCAKLPH